jgi:hypothetical protein
MDVLNFAVSSEVAAGDHILHFDRGAVGEAELPKRHLEIRALSRVRIEADMEQQEVGQVGRALAVVDDVVVPGFVEGKTGEILQRRVVSTEAVDEPNVPLQVAGLVHVPGADLVLLGVEVLLLAGHGLGLQISKPL